jgi:transcriptional regulator with XRE-family HTH domain
MYERIKELMDKKGVTLYRLSKATGIPYSTLAHHKNGETKLGIEKIRKIADYFGVSVDYLMGKEIIGEGYYINPETARIAQKYFEDSDLKALFDLASDSSPEDIKMAYSVLLALKEKDK